MFFLLYKIVHKFKLKKIDYKFSFMDYMQYVLKNEMDNENI